MLIPTLVAPLVALFLSSAPNYGVSANANTPSVVSKCNEKHYSNYMAKLDGAFFFQQTF
jgi:hypothetical protein